MQFVYHKIHHFKVCNSVISSIFTRLCNHHHNLTLEYSHHCKKISHAVCNQSSFLPSPSCWQLLIYFLSLWICLDSSHKWSNKIYDCLCLTWASLVAQLIKNVPAMWKTWVWSLGWEDPLEKGKATHSSILAWRIPWGHKESDMTK